MRTGIKKAMVLGAIVALLFAANTAAAYDKGCGPDDGRGEKRFEKLTKELGLTADQEAKLKAQKAEFKAKNSQLKEAFRAKTAELKGELDKPSIDRASVDRIIGELKNLYGEKLSNRVDKIAAMKGVLTPEQYSKLQDKMRQKPCAGKKGKKGAWNKRHGDGERT